MLALILNNTYEPINITSSLRAFNLFYRGKAEVLEIDGLNPFILGDNVIDRPTVVRLLYYAPIHNRRSLLTRKNLFLRDNNMCVYCDSPNNLTIDHVLPSSRGGKNTWQNMVTCCKKCNAKKDNKTPEEAKLTMRHKPFEPSYTFLIKQNSTYDKSWTNYLK
jgi:hypothetical protein